MTDSGLLRTSTSSGAGSRRRASFSNAGQGYRDAPDPVHIYAVFVGAETHKAFFENNDAMWLGRVPRVALLDRGAWTFYARESAGVPTWSSDDSIAVSIFRHPLMTAMQQVTCSPGLQRHIMAVWSWADPDGNPRGQLTSTNTEGPPHPRTGTSSDSPIKDGHDRTQLLGGGRALGAVALGGSPPPPPRLTHLLLPGPLR